MNKEKKLVINRKILSVFDFDGTLTYHDTFIPFLYFLFNKYQFINRIIRMIPSFCYYMKKSISHDTLKESLIKIFLTDMDEYWLCQQAEIFCKKKWEKIMRPIGILTVKKEVNSGAEVTICSASPTFLVKPFAKKLNIKYIGTELEIENNKLTGRIIGYNCRCAQKVKKLEHTYGNLKNYYIRAWGNTRGDYELLSIAKDSYWKNFYKSCNLHRFSK